MLKKAGLVVLAALACCPVLYCAVVVLPEWHYHAKVKPVHVARAEMKVVVMTMDSLTGVAMHSPTGVRLEEVEAVPLEKAEAVLLEEGFQKRREAASRYERRESGRYSQSVLGVVLYGGIDNRKWNWRCYAIVPYADRMFFTDGRDSRPTIWAADLDQTELEAVLAPEHPPLVAGGRWEAVKTYPARREEDSRDTDRNRD